MKLRQLSIGTFNLYNLNEPGVAIYTDRDGWTQAEYDLKIDFTRRMIQTLKPDILGLQELWHAASITRGDRRIRLAR